MLKKLKQPTSKNKRCLHGRLFKSQETILKMKIRTKLIETQQQTESFFNLPPSDLEKNYGENKWNVRKILVHLADAESVLHERLKRIISEPKQVILAFDQDLWSEKLNYQNFPLEISKSLYSANRKSIIYLADGYYEKFGDIEFVHSQLGIRTLKDEFDKVAQHNLGHINQIELALK